MAQYTKILGGDEYNRYKLVIEFLDSQNNATNKSTINYKGWLEYSGQLAHGRWWTGGSSSYLKEGSNTWASTNFSYDFTSYNRLDLFSGTKEVSHGTDGKLTLNLQAYVNLYNESYLGMSATLDIQLILPTIARASTFVSAEGYWTEGGNPKIKVDKKHSSYTHKLEVRMSAPVDVTIASGLEFSGTEYTIPLSGNGAYINRIYSSTPNHLNYKLKLILKTYSGSSLIGSDEKVIECKNNYAKPSVSGGYYRDTNATLVGKTGSDQRLVQSLSNLAIGAKITANKYATLKRFEVSVADKNYAYTASGTTQDRYVTIGKVDKAVNSATLKAIDSRGQESSLSLPLSMLAWIAPQLVQASADRRNSYEQDTYFNATVKRSIVKVGTTDINGSRVRYRIKQKNTSTWGSWTEFTPSLTSTSGSTATEQISNIFMENYPSDVSYDVEFGWRDNLENEWRTKTDSVSEGISLMSFYKDRITTGVPLKVQGADVATQAAIDALRDLMIDDTSTYRRYKGKGTSGWISPPVGTKTSSGIIPPVSDTTGYGYVGASGSPFINGYFANAVLIQGKTAWHDGIVAYSNGSNGYIKFPNGLILQWGYVNYNAAAINNRPFSFPLAFPNACLAISGNMWVTNANAENDWYAWVVSFSDITKTSAIIRARSGDNNAAPNTTRGYVTWIAIGK